MSWTEERIERLKKMWHDGATASQIADELGGVSRNAVIGKAHRLGPRAAPLAGEAGRGEGSQEGRRPRRAAPKPAPRPSPRGRARGPRCRAGRSPARRASRPRQRPPPEMQYRSIGPGGFIRQGPGDQQPPIPPAPPRRLVPAKPSPEVADKTSLLDLNDRICKWPIGHPGEPDFHFCGQPVQPRLPLLRRSIAASPTRPSFPRRDRRPPPPLPFGGPRVR